MNYAAWEDDKIWLAISVRLYNLYSIKLQMAALFDFSLSNMVVKQVANL